MQHPRFRVYLFVQFVKKTGYLVEIQPILAFCPEPSRLLAFIIVCLHQSESSAFAIVTYYHMSHLVVHLCQIYHFNAILFTAFLFCSVHVLTCSSHLTLGCVIHSPLEKSLPKPLVRATSRGFPHRIRTHGSLQAPRTVPTNLTSLGRTNNTLMRRTNTTSLKRVRQ